MPWARISLMSTNSVALFPCPRIFDITSDRLDFVKTSAIVRLSKLHGKREPAPCFVTFVNCHSAKQTTLLGTGGVWFNKSRFVSLFALFFADKFDELTDAQYSSALRFSVGRVQAGWQDESETLSAHLIRL